MSAAAEQKNARPGEVWKLQAGAGAENGRVRARSVPDSSAAEARRVRAWLYLEAAGGMFTAVGFVSYVLGAHVLVGALFGAEVVG